MSVLHDADKLINGKREQDYGSPQINWRETASLWSAYLGTTITAKDAVLMMALMKVARMRHISMPMRDAKDSVIDAAGYIGLVERLEE